MPNDIANNMADTIRFLDEENARLIESHIDLQLAYNEQMIELRETKRLLKLAVEDISGMDNHIYSCDRLCDDCPLSGERDHCLKWRYADEAEKLLKEG